MKDKNRKWRWGILGPGTIARKFAADLIRLDNVLPYSVGSSSSEKAASFKNEFGFEKSFSSYEDMLSDPELDIVYVSNINTKHFDTVNKALDAGKHVLCEKPITLDASQAEILKDKAEKNGLFLMEACWHLFHPVNLEVFSWVSSGEIGELKKVEASFGYAGTKDPSSRTIDINLGGGALVDVGIYPIVYALKLFGRQPEGLSCTVDKMPNGVDLTNQIVMDFGSGKMAVLSSSVLQRQVNRAVVTGSKGFIDVPTFFHPKKALLRLFGEDQEEISGIVKKAENSDAGTGYIHEAAEVMRCLDKGLIASEVWSMKDTLNWLKISDELRAGWGLVYPSDRRLI